MWVETHDLIIGVLYKPPNLLNREFLDLLEETLHTIHLSEKKCLIMGDVNINTLKKSNIAKEYLNLVRSEGFKQCIYPDNLKIAKVIPIFKRQYQFFQY